MVFQPLPDTAEIVIKYTGFGSNMFNVLAAHKAGGYDLADLESLAAAVDALVAADWLEIQTEDVSYVSTTVRGLASENDLEATDVTSAGPGEVVDIGMSGNVTFAIKKASGFTGRSARGRLYWIGMSRGQLSANKNRVDATAVAAIVAACELMRGGIVTEGWTPVIVSRWANGVKRAPTGEVFPWNSSVAVDDEVDSQRGRLLG